MNFTLDKQNYELIQYLDSNNDINQNEFINNIIFLGFQEFKNKNNTKINNIQNLENQMNTQFNNIQLLINEIKLENQNNVLILNKNNNKGIFGEKMIFDFFNKNNYQIEDTSEISHSGDLKLYLSEINKYVLLEIKNYKYTVDQKQIDKFYYDLNYTGIKLGIFISLQSKIVNIKYSLEWKITKNNEILIFISECNEDHLYLAIFCLISLYKHQNIINNTNSFNNEELLNDIKYLSLQKDTINKLKNEIITLHSSYSNSILMLYNNLCIFDNNFNYIIDKIYNKLDKIIIEGSNNKLYINLDNIHINNKDLLEIIISDLSSKYKLELIDNKKITILEKNNDIYKGEFKLLKTTINLVLESGTEIKNITILSWNKIKDIIFQN
jgi:hypothetical protein